MTRPMRDRAELRNALRPPPPFHLPEAKTRSGWRTQSVPDGGFHELSFEDAQGAEEIFASKTWAGSERSCQFER